jgi:hypothetical protein
LALAIFAGSPVFTVGIDLALRGNGLALTIFAGSSVFTVGIDLALRGNGLALTIFADLSGFAVSIGFASLWITATTDVIDAQHHKQAQYEFEASNEISYLEHIDKYRHKTILPVTRAMLESRLVKK